MSMKFKNQDEAKQWLIQSKGNKELRNLLDKNQKWSFIQARNACNYIIGGFENYEMDYDEQVEMLHGDRQELIEYIYFSMQREEYFEGGERWSNYCGKRHGYSTKNFVIGAIDYFCEKNGY